MSKKPKISIIVPVWNVEKYLNRCLDSLRNQTLKDIEILLIDDGSTDKSLKICKKAAKKDKRIRVFHQKNQGSSSARNAGLKHAKGKFVTFVDADDYLLKDCCQTIFDYIDKSKYDCLIFKLKKIYGREETVEQSNQKNSSVIVDTKLDKYQKQIISWQHDCDGYIYGNVWSKIYSRKFLQKNNITLDVNLKYCEDHLFALKVFEKLDAVLITDYVGYVYEIRQNSSFHGKDINIYRKCIKLLQEYDKFIEKYHADDPSFKKAMGIACFKIIAPIEGRLMFSEGSLKFSHNKNLYLRYLNEDIVKKYIQYAGIKDYDFFLHKIRHLLFREKTVDLYLFMCSVFHKLF